MAQDQAFDINSLLDGTLDDLADMPEFKPYPAGTHRVQAKLIDKTAPKDQVNKHPGFELRMSMIETIELAQGDAEVIQPKSEASVLYLLDNEMGQGQFKKILKSLAERFGAKSNRELIAEMSSWVECLVVTKQRMNKDKTQTYTDVVELQVV